MSSQRPQRGDEGRIQGGGGRGITLCWAVSPNGYLCSLDPGHTEPHEAHGFHGKVFDTWPAPPESAVENESPTETPEEQP